MEEKWTAGKGEGMEEEGREGEKEFLATPLLGWVAS